MAEQHEQRLVEAFVAQATIEALDIAVLLRLATRRRSSSRPLLAQRRDDLPLAEPRLLPVRLFKKRTLTQTGRVSGEHVIEREDGRRDMLDLAHLADRHLRPGWVRTIHSSQGATCDRVMAHLESFRANTVDAASVYVAISRTRTSAAVYTDSRANVTETLGPRDGAQVGVQNEATGQVGINLIDDRLTPHKGTLLDLV